MKAKMYTLTNSISFRLDSMLDRSRAIESLLNKNIYKIYLNAQAERWRTKGRSEGFPWKKLNPLYEKRKKIIYGGGPKFKWIGGRGEGRPWQHAGSWKKYPGAGRIMMIATSTLLGSVLGPTVKKFGSLEGTKEHRKITTQRSLQVLTTVDYAEAADKQRTFTRFSRKFWDKIKNEISNYLMKGKK